jgi:hypothetical protein
MSVLILLLIVFWAPELNLLIHVGENLITNSCVIQKIANRTCEPIHVENTYPATISMSLSRKPTLKFSTNLQIDNIDKQSSNIDILLIYADHYSSMNVNLTDSNVVLTNLGLLTEVTYLYPDTITEIVPVLVQLNIYDKLGDSGYSAMYTSTAQNGFDYFLERLGFFFQYLIWYFAIFGGAIRGVPWSIVYDSKTKEPIKGAIVRMFKDGRLYNTLVSDVNGIIKTQPEKGIYTINAICPGYKFPSSLMPIKLDGAYSNVYYGEEIRVTNEHTNLKISIPLDSQTNLVRSNIFIKSFRSVTSTIDLMAPYLIIFAVVFKIVVWPTYAISYFTAIIAAVLLGLQYLLHRQSEGQPGLVLNEVGIPLIDIKIDLYESEWNKKVDTILTNEKGEFEFVVPIKKYYLKIDSQQYKIHGRELGENYEISTKGVVGGILRINPKLVLERIKGFRKQL